MNRLTMEVICDQICLKMAVIVWRIGAVIIHESDVAVRKCAHPYDHPTGGLATEKGALDWCPFCAENPFPSHLRLTLHEVPPHPHFSAQRQIIFHAAFSLS